MYMMTNLCVLLPADPQLKLLTLNMTLTPRDIYTRWIKCNLGYDYGNLSLLRANTKQFPKVNFDKILKFPKYC